jgi:hypothetical protein
VKEGTVEQLLAATGARDLENAFLRLAAPELAAAG